MENPQPRTVQKWWKFCTISKCAKKIFFGKILCSTHQKKCIYKLLRLFIKKLNFWQKIHSRGPYKNGENFVLSQNVLRKCSLFHSSKEVFLLRKLNFSKNPQTRTLQKWWFLLSQNVIRKYFLAKFFVPLIKRSVSTNFKAVFGKLNFWQKIHSRGPYKNGENFVLSQNVLRKYFLATLFVPLIKRSFLQTFKAVLENWIFDGKSTAADLTKMVKILYYLKMC